VRGLIVAAAAVCLLAGCGAGKADEPTVVTRVSYVTGFSIRGQESYMYVAQEKGFFRDAGLDVKIVPGAGTGSNMKVLLAGKAEFAMLDLAGSLIEYAGPNQTRGFTLVAAVHQRTLSCLMALESSGIRSPRDLAGKTIGYTPGGVNYTMFPSYAKLAGLDPTSVHWRQLPPGQEPAVLAAGQVDVITQLVVGRPYVEAVAGGRTSVTLPYSDVMTDLYGNALGVTTATAREKPDLVRRFRDAMLKGLQYASDHPDEAGQIFAKRVPGYKAEVAAAETALLAPYVRADAGAPIGTIDPARVARAIALLQSAGAIAGPVTPEELVTFDLAP
jgi:NitT/TauT family transport system substrate-binding protein